MKHLFIPLAVICAIGCVCAAIGLATSYFFDLSWQSASLFTLAALSLIGQWLDDDGRIPGGYDYDPEESDETKRFYRVSAIGRYTVIVVSVALAIWLL